MHMFVYNDTQTCYLEGSTIKLSIKYKGNLFFVKFFVMLISCVLSIFSSKFYYWVASCVYY